MLAGGRARAREGSRGGVFSRNGGPVLGGDFYKRGWTGFAEVVFFILRTALWRNRPPSARGKWHKTTSPPVCLVIDFFFGSCIRPACPRATFVCCGLSGLVFSFSCRPGRGEYRGRLARRLAGPGKKPGDLFGRHWPSGGVPFTFDGRASGWVT